MKVTSKTSTKRILRATAALVDQGWLSGSWDEYRITDDAGKTTELPRPCYCLIGALSAVCTNGATTISDLGQSKIFDRAVKALGGALPKKYVKTNLKENSGSMDNPSYNIRDVVISWNDEDDRKIGQVMKVLEKAIEAA